MRFVICRASQFIDQEDKPHDKAFQSVDNVGDNIWLIDIDTLEELVHLEECGVVIEPVCENCDYPRIIIYDGYIE